MTFTRNELSLIITGLSSLVIEDRESRGKAKEDGKKSDVEWLDYHISTIEKLIDKLDNHEWN